jgi:uncharacterized protein (TIGR03663 family)
MREALPRSRDDLRESLSRPGVALLLVAAGALVARLYALGWRVAHQDEGRVLDWILHYREFGIWEYRPIIHGPFLPHVNGTVFSVLPPTDFSARLIVAVVGALLPLVAWLFRERLRDTEVVALGLLLAANPILLYYSRFMRNDLLVGAFMLAAVGFVVRAQDTGRARYLYAGSISVALAFTAKELALVYPVTWLGATALLLDRRLLWAIDRGTDWRTSLRTQVGRATATFWHWVGPLLIALLLFFGVLALFYAPKGTDPGLWSALLNPLQLPGVIEEALLGSWEKFVRTWGPEGHAYLPYFVALGKVLWTGALPLLAFALVGFLADRYTRHRDVVAFFFYWGLAHLVGFPFAVDNPFPWETVHVVAPFAVPAAVGVALVYRRGRAAFDREEVLTGTAAAVLLLAVAAQVGFVAAETSYLHPQSEANELVQYAQPGGEMQPTLRKIHEVAEAHDDGADVLYFGEVKRTGDGEDWLLHQETERWGRGEDPPLGWFSRLPLPWYFGAQGVETASTTDVADVRSDPAPVVIALGNGARGTPSNTAADVAPALEGYCRVTHQQYLYGRPLVFFVEGATGPACGG